MNPWRRRRSIATLSLLLTFSVKAQAQRLPPEIVVSNPQVFEVTIKTTFVVPRNGRNLTGLGVWHALPTARPWDGLDRTLGSSAISFEPASGRIQHLAHNESQNVFWELHEHLKPGKAFEFTSRFRVRSADRTYGVKRSTANWSDYHHNLDEITSSIDVTLDRLVNEIKKSHTPAEAAVEFCKWVTEHIQYDASVPYYTSDLPSILKYQKGHCGHQMALFEAMCLRLEFRRGPSWD